MAKVIDSSLDGIRDDEHPCKMFKAGYSSNESDCQGDGHYMCQECMYLDWESENSCLSAKARRKIKREVLAPWGWR